MLFCLTVNVFVKSAFMVSVFCDLKRFGCRPEPKRALSGDSFLLNDNITRRDNVEG